MKTILFGLNQDQDLNSTQTSLDKSNIRGQYLDTVSLDGVDYLITKVLESERDFHNDKIDVREIARDFYMDGSIANYSNIEKSEMCYKLEELLNSLPIAEKINRGVPIKQVLIYLNINYNYAKVNNLFVNELGKEVNEICVTSVRSKLFEELKNMTNSHLSAFSMFTRLNNLLPKREENQTQTTKTR